MTESFNKLTPGQLERLSLLLEECGEVIQAIGKIQRFGYDNKTNKLDLEHELGDLFVAVELLAKYDLSEKAMAEAIKRRFKKINKQLRHNFVTKENFPAYDPEEDSLPEPPANVVVKKGG